MVTKFGSLGSGIRAFRWILLGLLLGVGGIAECGTLGEHDRIKIAVEFGKRFSRGLESDFQRAMQEGFSLGRYEDLFPGFFEGISSEESKNTLAGVIWFVENTMETNSDAVVEQIESEYREQGQVDSSKVRSCAKSLISRTK